jgi:hypothetical protein
LINIKKILSTLSTDSFPFAESFLNKQSNAFLKVMSASHELNSKGYRCEEFTTEKEIKVVSIGCSDVFGYNLAKEERFSNIFCAKIAQYYNKTVANWNLGLPGKSNDYIGRMMVNVVNSLKPDIVLVNFTRILRREYFDIDGVCIDYIPGHVNIYNKEIVSHYEKLSSYNQDILNFYLNYKLVESLTKLNGIKFYFSLSLNNCGRLLGLEDILQLVDTQKYVGYFEVLDLTKDQHHPSTISNATLACKFFDKHITELYI